ncbi:MAG: GNAT family N-acetyltransferase [Clostridia bacterium]|nr:GNAT family N-acetyltransferase [Clostridia bacterium]
MYKRTDSEPQTATICRYMIDYRFQNKGLGKKAFKNILKYLKNCGISAVKSKRINIAMICLFGGFAARISL